MTQKISENDIKKGHLLRLVRKGALLGSPQTGPMEVGIVLTYACNYRCVFCALEHEKGGIKKDLPFEKAAILVKDLASLNTGQISFTGGGDPLCYKDIDRLVKLVRKNKMACSVCTNGSLMNESRIIDWSTMGVHLAVSINSSDAETYRLMHPGTKEGDFDRLTKTIERYARSAKEQGALDSFVSCNFVITNINYKQIESMAQLAEKMGAAQVQYRSIQPRSFHSHLFLNQEELAKARELLQNVQEQYKTNRALTIQSSGFLTNQKASGSFVCLEGVSASYIDSDGTVFPCCISSADIENHFMGNVSEESFEDIWNGKLYGKFRRDSFSLDIGNSEASQNSCRHCPKARHFQYLLDETAQGNLTPLYENAYKDAKKTATCFQDRLSGSMPKSAFAALYEMDSHQKEWKAGEKVTTKIKVSNLGDFPWPGIKQTLKTPVGLGYHLLDQKGRMISFDNNPRPYLPDEVRPKESAVLELEIRLPEKPGKYILEFDLLQETVSWFSSKGCPAFRLQCLCI